METLLLWGGGLAIAAVLLLALAGMNSDSPFKPEPRNKRTKKD